MSLDIEVSGECERYLIGAGRVGAEEVVGCRVLAGGVSSRTVLVERRDGRNWVLKQALPKLRVEMDWFSDPTRVHREALGWRRLSKFVPGRVPQFLFEDFENHVVAMEAVPEPHENWKTMLLAGRVDFNHIEQFANLLGTIHAQAWQAREQVQPLFEDRIHYESLRIEPYYETTAELVPPAREFMLALVRRTRERLLTLVHGDFSPKNVLVYQGNLVLLDHEVIHFGDPAFDVGFGMTHLLSKAHHLQLHRQTFAEAAHLFWRTYVQGLGSEADWMQSMEMPAVEHTLACLLARAAGKSPLEYLPNNERARQRETVVSLMNPPPATVHELIDAFLKRVDDGANSSAHGA